ncbi:uncharacterized protein LOC129952281 [Eupeodes corollae]|uniref:uncharacterized protein LOC129952281 n=1 Tax=Eupeodes corollae TaxID=290404 RepID=UPI002492F41C|nr:uncharacterized protein LOC129952281 [Eupeodes corollae]
MAKLISIALVVVVVAVCATEAARLRNFRQSRFSARQEVDPEQDVPAVTPYPPAGIVPEVRFNLPNEPELPEDPEKTYLPPDNLLPPAQTYGSPAQTYGPPEVETDAEGSGNDATLVDDDASQLPVEEEQADEPAAEEDLAEDPEAEEIVNPQFGRFSSAKGFRRQNARPAKLRAAKLQALPQAVRPRSQRLFAQPIYATNGALIAYRMLRV